MFALTRAFKFQQPIFAFSKLQLVQEKYVIPIKPKKNKNTDSEVHNQVLKEWKETYLPPKKVTLLSEKILYYGNKFPHLKAKWADLFQIVQQLPADEQAKDLEVINKTIQEKKQVYQQLLEQYDSKFFVKKSAFTQQQIFFSTFKSKGVDLKQLWVQYHSLSEEEKQKYKTLAELENQKLNERREKLAFLYGMSIKEFLKELRELSAQNRKNKKKIESSSSSDDEKSKKDKSQKQN